MQNPLRGLTNLKGHCPNCGWVVVRLTRKQPTVWGGRALATGLIGLIVLVPELLEPKPDSTDRYSSRQEEVNSFAEMMLAWSKTTYLITAAVFIVLLFIAFTAKRRTKWRIVAGVTGGVGLPLLSFRNVVLRWSLSTFLVALAIVASLLFYGCASEKRHFICETCGRSWPAE